MRNLFEELSLHWHSAGRLFLHSRAKLHEFVETFNTHECNKQESTRISRIIVTEQRHNAVNF